MIHTITDHLKKYSHSIVTIECDLKISSKCRNIWTNMFSAANIVRDNNNNKDICKYCASDLNQLGDKSHFFKYKKDENYFENIDSELKAYFLGWIASDGHVAKNKLAIKIIKADKSILELMRDQIVPSGIISDADNCVLLQINSRKISNDICKVLNLKPGPKDYFVSLPSFNNDNYTWAFLRGYFEGDGHIRKYNKKYYSAKIDITSVSKILKLNIKEFLNKFNINSCILKDKRLSINGRYAIEFIKNIYKTDKFVLARKYIECMKWIENNHLPKTKKLSLKIAKKIRLLYKLKWSIKDLMGKFNVTDNTIYDIINHKSYKERK